MSRLFMLTWNSKFARIIGVYTRIIRVARTGTAEMSMIIR